MNTENKENKKHEIRPKSKQCSNIEEKKVPIPLKCTWSEDDFKILDTVCAGKFGIVKKALHKATGKTVALKIIPRAHLKQFNCIDQVKTEIEIHTRLHHPYIIDCYGYFKDHEKIAIILEYADGGCLFNKKVTQSYLPEKEASAYIRQLIIALRYLHDLKVVHRDIKPENMLLKKGKIKLCDFGWAARMVNSQMRTSICGTLEYMSYELCASMKYDERVDIWSVGILAYELLTGDVPFKANSVDAMAAAVLGTKLPNLKHKLLSDDAFNFIASILVTPDKRAHLSQMLKHPFIIKYMNN